MQHTLDELDQRGRLADYVAEHDARRPKVGQITLLYGIKG